MAMRKPTQTQQIIQLQKEMQELKEQANKDDLSCVIDSLKEEIKAMQDCINTLQKTLKEHAENNQYLLAKINKTDGVATKNHHDIYNIKIKQSLHEDLLDRARPIIEIADPLTKQGFRITKLETRIEELQEKTKDLTQDQLKELKEIQETHINCISDLQSDMILQMQLTNDITKDITNIRATNTLQDKQIQALQKEVSKSVWELIKSKF